MSWISRGGKGHAYFHPIFLPSMWHFTPSCYSWYLSDQKYMGSISSEVDAVLCQVKEKWFPGCIDLGGPRWGEIVLWLHRPGKSSFALCWFWFYFHPHSCCPGFLGLQILWLSKCLLLSWSSVAYSYSADTFLHAADPVVYFCHLFGLRCSSGKLLLKEGCVVRLVNSGWDWESQELVFTLAQLAVCTWICYRTALHSRCVNIFWSAKRWLKADAHSHPQSQGLGRGLSKIKYQPLWESRITGSPFETLSGHLIQPAPLEQIFSSRHKAHYK